jgi:hypothetical protein
VKGEFLMMNVTKLVEAIERIVPALEVSVNKVQKGNVTLIGISIGNGDIKPIVYVEYFEDEYKNCGHNYNIVARKMIKAAGNAMKNERVTKVEITGVTTWKYAKKHLRLCIAPKGTNADCVVYPYLDLELYVRVIVNETEDGTASYKVKRGMIESWDITTEELLYYAMNCMKPLYNVKSMGETLYEITGDPMFLDESFPMIVANTKDGLNGASIMYCKDILKEVADKWEDDLIIIPSSIHECILKPLDGMELEQVTEIVNEVNTNEVDPTEVLSNHAYVFHRDTMEITW